MADLPEIIPGEENTLAEENKLICARRAAACVENTLPTCGLALSGGGIRSATFSLGVIRALAKNGLLTRFDYLSTVSGGGYVGGMLGRLYSGTHSANQVETALAKDSTLLLSWLRNNGRYLTPAGARDITLSIAQILRSFSAAFTLITLLSTLVCAVAVAMNPLFTEGSPGYFWVLSVPLALAGWQSLAYWVFEHKSRWLFATVIAITLIAVFFVFVSPQPASLTLFLCALCCIPWLWLFPKKTNISLSAFRLALTRSLAVCLCVFAALLVLWGINRAGYRVYQYFTGGISLYITIPVALTAIKALWEISLVKWIVKKLAQKFRNTKIDLSATGNLAGLGLMGLTLIFGCSGLFQLNQTISTFPCVIKNINEPLFASLLPWAEWLAALLIIVAIKNMIKFLNLSSLHNLYRARIERAWLSVANVGPGENYRFNTDPLNDKKPRDMNKISRVTEVMPKDDVLFKDYAPHKYGGPFHLITACINQTIDDRSGNYNADRKGIALTVSASGVETGTKDPDKNDKSGDETLSHWLAISGAATGTGMGSNTAPGLAFLLFLIGGRLGYWSQHLSPKTRMLRTEETPKIVRLLRGLAGRHIPETGYLLSELFARFPGLNSPMWFLSDGGHFENTGVYALLKRRVQTIVVTDCGADPNYIFDDMENLVRKAKIDYDITITFMPQPSARYGMLHKMTAETIAPPLLFARITYPLQPGEPHPLTGKLIVVKPHLLKGMALDTECYARRHSDFPQQTTADQFFNEEQWEAYHQLGLQAGRAIIAGDLK
ncbi:patatin-like phospholipase family protein [Buttiauxella noackiae]|uniref:patatin-like phospholipase family protein n=1 Tax=Buttiauxella noackiae TaxID=82992 RepID=UPI0028D8CC9A|nr:patatin-like phospholipase family protein [Buttiauxella noackiae]